MHLVKTPRRAINLDHVASIERESDGTIKVVYAIPSVSRSVDEKPAPFVERITGQEAEVIWKQVEIV